MSDRGISALGTLARGVMAGAVGTVAMDLLWWARARRQGSEQSFLEWEFSTGSTADYDDAGTPARVGRRVAEGLLDEDVADETAGSMTDLVHWATGLGYGALHGLVAGSTTRPRVSHGLVTGVGAFANSYTMLALMDLYEPVWEYEPETIYRDLSAHLVYGLAVAAAFRLVAGPDHGGG